MASGMVEGLSSAVAQTHSNGFNSLAQAKDIYKYQPLRSEERGIRLLTLHPGHFSDRIHVSLYSVTLPEKRRSSDNSANLSSELGAPRPACEPYEALSYTWGSAGEPSHVEIDDHIINVTKNLDIALRHLRLEREARTLWIDAICIDQSNLSERSSQVALMGEVYSLARVVLVWLGPSADNSAHALKFLDTLGQKVTVDWIASSMKPSQTAAKAEPHWADESSPMSYTEEDLLAIHCFFGRSWFERLWIRQEIKLAPSALMICGSDLILWPTFRSAVYCMCFKQSNAKRLLNNLNLTGEFLRRRNRVFALCQSVSFAAAFETLRYALRNIKWTEPRDAVYAVLNILRIPERELGIRPDYQRSTADIYTDVAVRCIQDQRSLALLSSCEIDARDLPGLPTWVPDWSTQTKVSIVLPRRWSACAWISAQTEFLGDGILRAAGVRVDVVDQVRPLDIDDNEFRPDEVANCIRTLIPSSKSALYLAEGEEEDPVVDKYCQAMYCYPFADHFSGQGESGLRLHVAKDVLRSLWYSQHPIDPADQSMDDFLFGCFNSFAGRCFISTSNGYVGLAPRGAKPGDVLCVLLGSHESVLLREVQEPKITGLERWEVVGTCHVSGLLHGEAIHGHLPPHYTPAQHVSELDRIDDTNIALRDRRHGSYETNPAKVLEELGIPVVRFQRKPHLLEVSPQALRDAGVDLRDFYLI